MKSKELEKVLNRAKKIAAKYGHPRIGSEHILMAMLNYKKCGGYKKLIRTGADITKILSVLTRGLNQLGTGLSLSVEQITQYTPSMIGVMRIAEQKRASNRRSTKLNSGHVLLSILDDKRLGAGHLMSTLFPEVKLV